MLAYQIFFAMFAISIPAVTLVVAGKHLWVMAQSIRAQKFLLGFLSFLAAATLVGLFVAVGAVWFGYGVAHSKKDLSTDLVVILVTGVPFYRAAYGLWRFARYLLGRTKSPAV